MGNWTVGLRMPKRNVSQGRVVGLLCAALVLAASGCDKRKSEIVTPPSDPCATVNQNSLYPIHQTGPSWSRSTGLIAYSDRGIACVDLSGAYYIDTTLAGIYVVDPVNSQRRRLTPGGNDPAWSPDGDRIAFELGRQIFVINADGMGLRQLTTTGENLRPAWHPAGKRISYEMYPGTGPIFYSLWIIGDDGSNPQPLCVPDEAGARDCDWDPAGSQYVYVGFASPDAETLFAIDTTSCNERRLTGPGALFFDPVYSPAGSRIAFTTRDVPPSQIWVMNADGSNPRQLTTNGGEFPSWSPDGARIVYTRSDARLSCPEQGVLWTVNVRTGTQTQLLDPWPSRCASPTIALKR